MLKSKNGLDNSTETTESEEKVKRMPPFVESIRARVISNVSTVFVKHNEDKHLVAQQM